MARAETPAEELAALCCPPTVRCHNPFLQDPLTQKWILIQLYCGLLNYFADEVVHDCTDPDALKALGECWWCQGSPAKLQLTQMQIVCEAVEALDCSQPVCWSPLELEATLTELICELTQIFTGQWVPEEQT
jgi:hypothetical protein